MSEYDESPSDLETSYSAGTRKVLDAVAAVMPGTPIGDALALADELEDATGSFFKEWVRDRAVLDEAQMQVLLRLGRDPAFWEDVESRKIQAIKALRVALYGTAPAASLRYCKDVVDGLGPRAELEIPDE